MSNYYSRYRIADMDGVSLSHFISTSYFNGTLVVSLCDWDGRRLCDDDFLTVVECGTLANDLPMEIMNLPVLESVVRVYGKVPYLNVSLKLLSIERIIENVKEGYITPFEATNVIKEQLILVKMFERCVPKGMCLTDLDQTFDYE